MKRQTKLQNPHLTLAVFHILPPADLIPFINKSMKMATKMYTNTKYTSPNLLRSFKSTP